MTSMTYAKVAVLSDTPREKTICVEFEHDTQTRATQVLSVLVTEKPNRPQIMVTVIVKNAHLPQQTIKALAKDFIMGKLPLSGGLLLGVDA